jgi:uncharacterized membrane protein YfcA
METTQILIILAVFAVAVLYSSVGQGGASGYLAVMALFAIALETTKPTALILNLFVALIAFVQFYRAGNFSWKLFLPFAAGSIPRAFIGGMIHLPTTLPMTFGFGLARQNRWYNRFDAGQLSL